MDKICLESSMQKQLILPENKGILLRSSRRQIKNNFVLKIPAT